MLHVNITKSNIRSYLFIGCRFINQDVSGHVYLETLEKQVLKSEEPLQENFERIWNEEEDKWLADN